MDAVYEYLALKLDAPAFCRLLQTDDALIARIQAKIPASRDIRDEAWKASPMNPRAFAHDEFDLRRMLTRGYYHVAGVHRCSTAYRLLWELFASEYPEVERASWYSEVSLLAMDTVPEAVDSLEAGELLFGMMEKAMEMPKKERKAFVKGQVAQAFHLNEVKKKPQWLQSSEWPVRNGRPLRFVLQKIEEDGGLAHYVFEDPETREWTVVMQSD